jgi:hypothetical protein
MGAAEPEGGVWPPTPVDRADHEEAARSAGLDLDRSCASGFNEPRAVSATELLGRGGALASVDRAVSGGWLLDAPWRSDVTGFELPPVVQPAQTLGLGPLVAALNGAGTGLPLVDRCSQFEVARLEEPLVVAVAEPTSVRGAIASLDTARRHVHHGRTGYVARVRIPSWVLLVIMLAGLLTLLYGYGASD